MSTINHTESLCTFKAADLELNPSLNDMTPPDVLLPYVNL